MKNMRLGHSNENERKIDEKWAGSCHRICNYSSVCPFCIYSVVYEQILTKLGREIRDGPTWDLKEHAMQFSHFNNGTYLFNLV